VGKPRPPQWHPPLSLIITTRARARERERKTEGEGEGEESGGASEPCSGLHGGRRNPGRAGSRDRRLGRAGRARLTCRSRPDPVKPMDQVVRRDQVVRGDQAVQRYQVVKKDQVVRRDQVVKRDLGPQIWPTGGPATRLGCSAASGLARPACLNDRNTKRDIRPWG
jgi:hypothetical protein